MKHASLVDIENQKQALICFIKKHSPFYQFVDFSLYDLDQLSMVVYQLNKEE